MLCLRHVRCLLFADTLFQEYLSSSGSNTESAFTNALLVHLGLLKVRTMWAASDLYLSVIAQESCVNTLRIVYHMFFMNVKSVSDLNCVVTE